MELDPFVLSRWQFAANITFHILFPTITIALSWVLLFFKYQYNRTGDEAWINSYFFFTKIFALNFALGVVSGITMSFQFGTNWPGFMEHFGNLAGPLLAYEVLTAFFLEAGFLGIMLFGFRKVPPWLHNLATFFVAFGTTLSAFWILVLNSWMQTPHGFEMIDGVAHATNWLDIIFNPSMPYRMTHMLLASGITASFFIAGVSAYRWLRQDRTPAVRKALRTGVFLAAILTPTQIFVGDLHGLNTLKHQPAKIAAMEGIWETKKGAPLVLFGMPNAEQQRNDFAIEIPKLASLILTHQLDGELKGLNEFEGSTPPVKTVFWSFRVMVATGILMLLISWWVATTLWRKKELSKPQAKALCWMTFSGWVATVAGWFVTEVGRQPYIVYGVLKTKEALGPVKGGMVFTSFVVYMLVYLVLLSAFITTVFYMARRAGHGGHRDPEGEETQGAERLSALAKN